MFEEDKEGVDREWLSEYPYLLILLKLWPGDWNYHLRSMNIKVDENNGKYLVMVNGLYQNVWRFSSSGFWNNIGCLISDLTFGLGGLIMW